jgi:CHASE3 domain sensor protein
MNGNFLKRSEKATLIVFIAVPLLVAILVFLFLKQMYLDQQQGLTLVKHSYEVREQLLELRNDLIQSEAGQSIFLLTGSHSYLQPSLFAASDAFVRLQYLSVLLVDRPDQSARVSRLRPLIEKTLAENRGSAFSKDSGPGGKELEILRESQDANPPDQISAIIREMQADEDQVLSVRKKVTQSDVDARATVSTVLLSVSAAVIIGAGILLVKIRQLQSIITICAWTQRVNFNGRWMRMEDFLWHRFRVKVSHGISEEAFEGVMGVVGKNITVSDDRAGKANNPKPQLGLAPGN